MTPFEWGLPKAAANLREHGIDFYEAATVFGDPLALVIPDPEHSFGEERLVIIGISNRNRVLLVSHVERGAAIRIISARRARPHKRKDYEEGRLWRG